MLFLSILNHLDKAKDMHKGGVKRSKTNIGRKQVEGLVVLIANTVINPGTMMVHFKNALIALRAVVGSDGLPFEVLAFSAEGLVVRRSDFLHVPGVLRRSHYV